MWLLKSNYRMHSVLITLDPATHSSRVPVVILILLIFNLDYNEKLSYLGDGDMRTVVAAFMMFQL